MTIDGFLAKHRHSFTRGDQERLDQITKDSKTDRTYAEYLLLLKLLRGKIISQSICFVMFICLERTLEIEQIDITRQRFHENFPNFFTSEHWIHRTWRWLNS